MHPTLPLLRKSAFPVLHRRRLETLQVNLSYRCNQACSHCHVNAGPTRTEAMSDENVGLVERVLAERHIQTLDLTGGAPEMHPHFRRLAKSARDRGVHVIDRCNLTILTEPGFEDLPQFLAAQGVEIIASLPCYSAANVDKQRGEGVFAKSVTALQRLNALGYGGDGSGLVLNLVYNPQGPTLPPNQTALESDYKRELFDGFGIRFNRLYVLVNMPIKRFGSTLISKGQFNDYIRLLKTNFIAANLDGVMCRTLISVDWQGFLYDCDFNQQLGLPLSGKGRLHLGDLLAKEFDGRPIAVADHCYGCTAGQGSSCGGALKSA